MRLQTGKIVLKYIENFVRREREAVNRFRDFLSDVVRQSDMVLLSLCTVSTLYGMVPNEATRQRALQILRGTPGIFDVVDQTRKR